MNLIADLTTLDVATIAAIFLLGGLVKGALGFGLPLVTMSILPLVVSVDFALAINALVLPFTNFKQFFGAACMRETIWRFRYVLGGIVVGVPIGAVLVSIITDQVLMLSLGISIICFVVLTVASPELKIPKRHDSEVAGAVGLLGGIVGALTTANGPIFLMHLVAMKVERTMFISALGLLFIVSGVLISGAFWLAGLMDAARVAVAAISLPAALAGMSAGDTVGQHIPAEIFRRIVIGVLCLLALNLIVRGLAGS